MSFHERRSNLRVPYSSAGCQPIHRVGVVIPRRGSGEIGPEVVRRSFDVEDIDNVAHLGLRAKFDLGGDELADMYGVPN
jgi:hypothetical protein